MPLFSLESRIEFAGALNWDIGIFKSDQNQYIISDSDSRLGESDKNPRLNAGMATPGKKTP